MLAWPEILRWLREEDPARLAVLWRRADEVRREHVGDEVHLRGLVEFSSHCVRQCAYCGLRAANRALARYRMTEAEILGCAAQAVALGYGTLVLQSGEDDGCDVAWLAGIVRRVKDETPLAVTLSVGERDEAELAEWRAAGADRYLLRFETSNPALFRRIHPPRPGHAADGALWRVALLKRLRALGYEIGSGCMIGVPGQTYADLAADLELCRALDLDMIGVGPFLPHPATPLGAAPAAPAAPDQAPATELMTYKMIALARLLCPRANIPATTALATINRAQGRELGLARGANVVMPNLTPVQYRRSYEIYPAKACVDETAQQCHGCLSGRIRGLGRRVGAGRGDSAARQHRDGCRGARAGAAIGGSERGGVEVKT
ncbi:MAG TPA: [FeFe] hydrogenase H-cluster radical SAM maturase HydE [Polyangia bacterium]|jgi:biotin synthase